MSRLDELFEQALPLEASERDAWLAGLHGPDAGLRERLARLLAADARCGGVLEADRGMVVASFAVALAGPGDDASAPPLWFGPWRVLRPLGSGGMGEVWLGERSDAGFVQRAAIKQVAWPTPGLLQRFERERQILARLEHPNIARLIDGGVDAHGCPYLAMEFVEGVPITQWVRSHALDARATVALLLQLCRAVQFAHANLVVHSDIKPSNVLVAADGTPRLLDFGIARVLGDEPGAAATRSAMRLLTPEYAAPELLRGAAATTSVDVHALGVLAFELLTGDRPRHAGTDPGKRHAVLRGDLGRIVLTAMAPEPAARYPSVDAFAADLRAWRDGLPVSVRADSAWYRMRKFVQRNRVAVAAACAIVLTLSAATAYSARQARIANQQMRRAQAVREFLADAFAAIDPARNEGRQLGLPQLLAQGEQRLQAAADMPTPVRADLMGMIGTFYWDMADNPGAERSLEAAVAMAAGGGVPARVHARNLAMLAKVEADRNDYRNAYAHAREAHQLALPGGAADRELAATTRRLAAAMMVPNVGPRRAEPALRALLEDDRAAFGSRSPPVVYDLILLGQALDRMGRYAQAQAALEQSANLARGLEGPDVSWLGLALDILGTTLLHRGDFDASRRALEGSREVTTRLWGADNVRSSIVRGQLLELQLRRGQAATALPGLLRVRDEARRMRDARPDHYAAALTLIGDARLALGQSPRAAAAYRQALVAWSRVPQGADADGMAQSFTGLSGALRMQGRLDDAERASRNAIAIDGRAPGAPPQALARDRAALAEALLARGDLAGARKAAAMAVEAARRTLPEGNWQQAPALQALARVEAAAATEPRQPDPVHLRQRFGPAARQP